MSRRNRPRSNEPQGRYWMLTVPHEHFTPYLPDGVAYIRGQLETGEQTGYLHWQLLVLFSRSVRASRLTVIFGPFNHELTRSAAADEYVWKENTRVEGTQFELGRRPIRRNNATDWGIIWNSAKDGLLENIQEAIRFQHYRTIRTIRADFAKPVGMERSCSVFWGATGTGKSRRAWSEAGLEAYPKNPRTKWFDGYSGQRHIVIDEFRGGIDVAYLLQWFDRYPVLVEIKGAAVPLKATNFWITSNLNPNDWYPGLDEDTKRALFRRMNITHYVL